MSCCPASGSYSSKDAAFNNLASKSGSFCKLCVSDLTVQNLTILGDILPPPYWLPHTIGTSLFSQLIGSAQYAVNPQPQLGLLIPGDAVEYKINMPQIDQVQFRLSVGTQPGNLTAVISVTIPGVTGSPFVFNIGSATTDTYTTPTFAYPGGASTVTIALEPGGTGAGAFLGTSVGFLQP
jgi:hypothetical protein